MLRLYRAVVGAKEPALQERGNPVDTGHRHVSRHARTEMNLPLVLEAESLQRAIGGRAIGPHPRAGLDAGLHERNHRGVRVVRNTAQANTTKAPRLEDLDGEDHKYLVCMVFSSGCRTLPIRDRQEAFVHLDQALQPLSSRPHHRSPVSMQQRAGGLIASKLQYALQAQCAHALLLIGQVPCRRHHTPSGVRVLSKVVPEVTVLCRPQDRHINRPRLERYGGSDTAPAGHANPRGHRSFRKVPQTRLFAAEPVEKLVPDPG